MPPRNLLEETDWQNRVSRDSDLSFVKTPKKAADALAALEKTDPMTSLEIKVRPGESMKQTRGKQKVQSFIDLVKSGLSPEDAAERIGLDLGEISRISNKTDMARIVSETLETGHIRSDIRKEYLRAGLNKLLTEALVEGDRKEYGNLYKLAAADPEIGLTGPSTVNAIQVNFSDLMAVAGEFLPPEEKSVPEPTISLDSETVNIVRLETSETNPQTEG